jgi:hypothetical protein
MMAAAGMEIHANTPARQVAAGKTGAAEIITVEAEAITVGKIPATGIRITADFPTVETAVTTMSTVRSAMEVEGMIITARTTEEALRCAEVHPGMMTVTTVADGAIPVQEITKVIMNPDVAAGAMKDGVTGVLMTMTIAGTTSVAGLAVPVSRIMKTATGIVTIAVVNLTAMMITAAVAIADGSASQDVIPMQLSADGKTVVVVTTVRAAEMIPDVAGSVNPDVILMQLNVAGKIVAETVVVITTVRAAEMIPAVAGSASQGVIPMRLNAAGKTAAIPEEVIPVEVAEAAAGGMSKSSRRCGELAEPFKVQRRFNLTDFA